MYLHCLMFAQALAISRQSCYALNLLRPQDCSWRAGSQAGSTWCLAFCSSTQSCFKTFGSRLSRYRQTACRARTATRDFSTLRCHFKHTAARQQYRSCVVHCQASDPSAQPLKGKSAANALRQFLLDQFLPVGLLLAMLVG